MGAAAPFIAAGAALVGAGAAVYGGISGASAQREAAGKQQDAANAQATIADMSAIDALSRGRTEAGRIREAGSRLISQQRTAYAGAGVDVGSGTAVDVVTGTRVLTELDALTVQNSAARAAWGFQEEAHNLRRHGAYARQAGEAQAAGTLLTGIAGGVQGVGTAASIYTQYGRMPTIRGRA